MAAAMGIFDFVQSAGESIFGKSEETLAKEKAEMEAKAQADYEAAKEARRKETSDKLRAAIADYGFAVDEVEVDYDVVHARVTLTGKVATQEEREKLVLIVGNVEGVAQVDDQLEVEKAEPEATFHTVVKGDTLSKIAKSVYGDAMKYKIIFEANKPMLKNPDLIYPGQVLRIPPLAE